MNDQTFEAMRSTGQATPHAVAALWTEWQTLKRDADSATSAAAQRLAQLASVQAELAGVRTQLQTVAGSVGTLEQQLAAAQQALAAKTAELAALATNEGAAWALIESKLPASFKSIALSLLSPKTFVATAQPQLLPITGTGSSMAAAVANLRSKLP